MGYGPEGQKELNTTEVTAHTCASVWKTGFGAFNNHFERVTFWNMTNWLWAAAHTLVLTVPISRFC